MLDTIADTIKKLCKKVYFEIFCVKMLIWPILPIWADPHSLLLLTAALKVTESIAYTAALAESGPGWAPAFRLFVNPLTAILEAWWGLLIL